MECKIVAVVAITATRQLWPHCLIVWLGLYQRVHIFIHMGLLLMKMYGMSVRATSERAFLSVSLFIRIWIPLDASTITCFKQFY